ncbi:glutamate racemase [Agarivorans sp.]|uniref:glutamate racemase n=1 Tax=Agarivorans sp. TaxID=1872412 RepID=UPI003D05C5F8
MHVLVFDSGVGGLSILEQLQALNPELQYSYLFDNLYFPYGELSENTLIQRVKFLLSKAVSKLNPDLLVVACNSASTLSLPYLREALSIPVVGVVPAIKSAAMLSKTRHFGVIATPGTVERAYTEQLIADFAEDCKVELLGSTSLVKLAEQKLAGQSIELSQVEQALRPWLGMEDLDCVVLGCTHFPLLKAELQQVLGQHTKLIDSGEAIAKRVRHLLQLDAYTIRQAKKMEARAYCTKASTELGFQQTLQAYRLTSLQLFT